LTGAGLLIFLYDLAKSAALIMAIDIESCLITH